VFALVQAMLGLELDAPQGVLRVDPALPDWLPQVTLRDLRVGANTFDIEFRRREGGTEYEVLRGNPEAVVRRGAGVA
jgi:hypothetical protein